MPAENFEEKAYKGKHPGGRPRIYKTPEEKAAHKAELKAAREARKKEERELAREAGLINLSVNRKEIDREEFEKLCAMQCTREEIAAFFGVGDKLICEWCQRTYGEDFETVFAEKRKGGLASLRRIQWKWAESNVVMAIFLGKNYLGQADTPDAQLNEATLNKAKEILGGVESAIE